MEKIKVIFLQNIINKEIVYMRNLNEEILDTFQEVAKELNKDFSELFYLCDGNKIDFSNNPTFDEISNSRLDKKSITVTVSAIMKIKPFVESTNMTNNESSVEKINMFLTEDYIPQWGFKEGLREFIQNQHDGIINEISKEENLIIKRIGEKYKNFDNPEDFDKFLNFEFFDKNNNEKLGEILYDEKKRLLTITNKGEIILRNLYLGSKKEKNNNNEIIGQFGEGMKLGILSLLRKDKKVNIISSNNNFYFELCGGNFEKDDTKILFCNLSKYHRNDMKNKVKVIISNITKNEWNDEIFKFLWLLDMEKFNIYLSEEYGKKIGEVLAEPIFENKLYCKGIYVQNIQILKKDKADEVKSKKIPGFNVYDLKLDRDRNFVQNTYDMKKKLGKIWMNALRINKRYSNYNPKFNNKIEEKKEIAYSNSDTYDINYSELVYVDDYGNKFLSETLINLLSDKGNSFFQDYSFYSNIRFSINNDEAYKLWRTWEKMNNIEHRNPPKFQPADSETIKNLGKFFEKNKLNKNFYLYFEVSKPLMEILAQSNLYLGYEQKFTKYIINSPNVDLTSDVKYYLEMLEKKVEIPNFNKDFVSFKKFDYGNDIYYYDDIKKTLFFSHSKMNDINNIETKYWIFVNILKVMDIQIENCYKLNKKFFTYIKR